METHGIPWNVVEKRDIFGANKVDLARSDWDLMSYVSVIPKLINILTILAAISLAHEWNFPVFLLIFICIFIYKGRSCLCIYLYSHNSRHTEISTQLGQNSRYKSSKSCGILIIELQFKGTEKTRIET